VEGGQEDGVGEVGGALDNMINSMGFLSILKPIDVIIMTKIVVFDNDLTK